MLSVWVIISTSAKADQDVGGYTLSDDSTELLAIPNDAAISVPSTVTTIADDVFKDKSNITTINIPDSVTNLGTGFQGCTGLQTVTLGTGVTSLGADTFYNCTTLSTVNFPSNLTTISADAFRGCTGLKTIDIPASCTNVDPNAFSGCSNMVGFTLSGGSNTYSVSSDNCLYSLGGQTLVNVPDGKIRRVFRGIAEVSRQPAGRQSQHGPGRIGIDTGAYYTGNLTVLKIDGNEKAFI